jgi:hypothetical protein
MGERSSTTVTSKKSFTETGLLCGTTVRILSVQYEDWHEPDGGVWDGWSFIIGDWPFNAKILAKLIYKKTDSTGAIFVASDATPGDLGIVSGAFSEIGTSPSTLAKVLTWDSRFNGGTGTSVGAIEFDSAGNPVTDSAKAYLLNCADSPASLRAAVEGFKIESFSAETLPKSSDFEGKGYNGRVVVKGAVTLGDWYDVDESTGRITVAGMVAVPKFFKAMLVR